MIKLATTPFYKKRFVLQNSTTKSEIEIEVVEELASASLPSVDQFAWLRLTHPAIFNNDFVGVSVTASGLPNFDPALIWDYRGQSIKTTGASFSWEVDRLTRWGTLELRLPLGLAKQAANFQWKLTTQTPSGNYL